MDLLWWMGAVRVQTADKNISNMYVIHMTPVHQLMSCEAKRFCDKRPLSIILLSPVEKVVWIGGKIFFEYLYLENFSGEVMA